MQSSRPIKNSFLDTICLFLSFIVSFYRSVRLLVFPSKKPGKKNLFFDLLDFVFRLWPQYFWEKPTWLKLTSFFGDFVRHIFKK